MTTPTQTKTRQLINFIRARIPGPLDWKVLARRFWNGTTHSYSGVTGSIAKRFSSNRISTTFISSSSSKPLASSNAHSGLADTYVNGDHHLDRLMNEYPSMVCCECKCEPTYQHWEFLNFYVAHLNEA